MTESIQENPNDYVVNLSNLMNSKEAVRLIEEIKKIDQKSIKEIHQLLYLTANKSNEDDNKISKTLSHFATLLVKLSIQAENQSKRIINLTWALLIATIVLLVVTIYQNRNLEIQSKAYQATYDMKMDSLLNTLRKMELDQKPIKEDNKKAITTR
jgi:F0F1-type ATP synthase membrane subunit a